jgi:UPF0755 protein
VKKRRNCLAISILAILFCVSLAIIAVLISNLPAQVEASFGPPTPSLNITKRIYYSVLLFLQEKDLTRPIDRQGAMQDFIIMPGESTTSVIGRLWHEGFIHNPGAFRTYLLYAGLDTSMQAGNYQLSPSMTSLEIARILQDATIKDVTFYVFPGWRAEEIAYALTKSGIDISQEAFVSAVNSRFPEYPIFNETPSLVSAEGFLFPGEYLLPREITARQLVKIFLDRFETQVSLDVLKGIKRQKLTLFEAVILASIVEREAIIDEEKPMIASVYINRLNQGMKLDADPTVQYAIGFNHEQNSWWTNPLSLDDLQIDSPYNTYLYPNLPPGPIANPGLEALKAVALPAHTPYFYFRAACDNSGRHLFSKTYEEHLQNQCK